MDMKIKRGQILKELRLQRKLSQQNIADILKVSARAYQKYEYGTAEPTFDSLSQLADFYDVTTEYLLGRPNAKLPVNPVDEFASKTQMKEQEQIVLKKWLALDEKQRQTVFNFMVDIVHECESELNKEADEPNKNPETVSKDKAVENNLPYDEYCAGELEGQWEEEQEAKKDVS